MEGLTDQQESPDGGGDQPDGGGCGVPGNQHQLLSGGDLWVAQTVHRPVSSGQSSSDKKNTILDFLLFPLTDWFVAGNSGKM